MEALRKKLASRRGASILMALLFLLLCMMVGTSVLMAAASNAGKIRSNQEEQQKYLTLSSALTLLCDELEDMEYVGQYYYGCIQVFRRVYTYDEDGNVTGYIEEDVRKVHYYEQETGVLRKKDGDPAAEWRLKEVFPLYNDLDSTFSDYFQVPLGQKNPVDQYRETPLSPTMIFPLSPHSVTIAAAVDEETYGGLADQVDIEGEVDGKGKITLTATLKDHPEYVMEAVLKPEGSLRDILTLSASPAKKPAVVRRYLAEAELPPSLDKDTEMALNETAGKLTWTLERIVKKEGAGA